MSKLQVFTYKGREISFDFSEKNRMINATQMAKGFGKKINNFLRQKSTQEYIKALLTHLNSSVTPISVTEKDLIYTNQGGNPKLQGTWMHRILALRFAQWLDANFAIWVDEKIQELLLKGSISIHSKPLKSITYIYFVKATKLNLVKIGMTENLHHRLNNLKVNSPDGLELVKVIRTNDIYPNDQAIHLLFPHLRSHGEWYFWTAELQNFVNQLEANMPEVERTSLYYERRIAELQLQIAEQQQRIFKNKQLIHQLTRELGQAQKQYHQLLNKQDATLQLLPPLSSDTIIEVETAPTPPVAPYTYTKVLFMAKGDKWEGVKVKDIVYLQGQRRFTRIFCKNQVQYEVPQTMNQLLEQLPPKAFVKIHRSYIINLKYLTNITPKKNVLVMNETVELPISRGQFGVLVEKIQVLKRK